ncbi:hypothetical protein NX059_003070 [Plenodomus lindquistii]|nr:hypothetical protein NX059_003070 [Plenodomus lindquistii]
MGLLSKPKSSEAAAEQQAGRTSQDNPPNYDSTPAESAPPSYTAVQIMLTSLSQGDPNETILVPMVMRRDSTSLHRFNPFSRKGYENTPSYISLRAMKRSMYTAHYAKDSEGNYIGTGVQAPDAGLVFVAGKGTSEDLLKQCEGVAKEMQKRRGEGIGNFGKPFDAQAGRVHGGMTGAGIGGAV